MKYPEKTACFLDHGLFVETAIDLQKDFGRVLYTTPWQCAFPKSNETMIGLGLVERIESIWDHLDEIDVFIFPDIYHGPTQIHLEDLGKRVWGSRSGDVLEIWRIEAKKYMRELGIDIGPYTVVGGSDQLRSYLKKHKDVFVKVSKTRGDFETFHSFDFDLSEPWLDDLEHRLGPKKKFMEFIVEEAIDPALEIGFDGYCIDGEFSTPGIVGVEIKDCGYLGKVSETLPEELLDVNTRLSDTFKRVNYRNFFSSEIRIKDGKGYMLDPCTRIPAPPGDLYSLWFRNLAEIIWEGSGGKMIDPDYSGEWGAELLLTSEWSSEKWTAIEIPKDLRANVKLRARVKKNGKDYVVPGFGIGACVVVAETADKAIEECERIADEVKGLGLSFKKDSLKKAQEEFAKIEFPRKAVEPEIEPVDENSLSTLLASAQNKSLSETLSGAIK